ENQLNQRIVYTIPPNWQAAGQYVGVLRYNAATGSGYVACQVAGNAKIYFDQSGTLTELASAPISPAVNTAHSYQFDFSTIGSNPTKLALTVTALTPSAVVATLVGADSTASVQAPGEYGLNAWGSGASFSANLLFGRATTYFIAPSTLAVTPSTGGTNQ